MKILVAPLNWGLGHASRCVPLVRRFLDEGHEVILGGDGESLVLLRRHFPTLRYVYLAPLALRYSRRKSQVWAILKALPALVVWAIKDHLRLKALLREEAIDRVVSDNRFGLYNKTAECIYLTHQLHIFLPRGWKWLEPIAARIHVRIYARYNKVWVPDYEEPEKSLAGDLSHIKGQRDKGQCIVSYIGPLSRFSLTAQRSYSETVLQRSGLTAQRSYTIVAVLSGLEPQRTLLEKELLARYRGGEQRVLLVQGLLNRPATRIKRGNITIVPSMTDSELVPALLGAQHIIARSGYSTIMDLETLGLIQKAELIPTPGQPEQEYLAFWTEKRTSK
jgi:hypothetical protein